MKLKRVIRLLVLLIILAAVFNYKSIGRFIYPMNYSKYIYKYSTEYNLDPYIVVSVIKAESNFESTAKSNKDAYGLMQITDPTAVWAAREMKIKNYEKSMLYDPEFNIKMGCWYLNNLIKEFDGNVEVALAAYNAGRGNVQKWLKDTEHSKDGENLHYIPFKETDKYVKKIRVNYHIYKYLYDMETKVSGDR